MPNQGEARKRITFYHDSVLVPGAANWDANAVPHEEIIPNNHEEEKDDSPVAGA